MPQHIALTGATGFVGRHLLRRLLDEGHSVNVLVRNPEALTDFNDDSLTVTKGDLQSDLSNWAKSADCIIHLAGLVKAKTWSDYDNVNVKGASAVAQAATHDETPHIILMSSMAARAPELSYYAKSKYLGEEAVKSKYSGALSIIRAPAVFGPGDKATKPIFDFMRKGWLLSAGGRGWKKRSVAMVYVDDLVDNILSKALGGAYINRTVSPSSIGAMTMPEFAGYASRALKKPVRAVPIPLSLLYPLAAVTTITLRLFGIGHLSLGKLAEFRYEHWQSNDLVTNPTLMTTAIKETINSYV